jgi:hypothetical protein
LGDRNQSQRHHRGQCRHANEKTLHGRTSQNRKGRPCPGQSPGRRHRWSPAGRVSTKIRPAWEGHFDGQAARVGRSLRPDEQDCGQNRQSEVSWRRPSAGDV